jgi:Spy/CpxP family protein refolding chaperone
MKKTFFGIAALMLLAAGMSFGIARWLTCRHEHGVSINLHDAAWLKGALGMTPSQFAEVEKCEREFRVKMESSCAAHCAARFALGEELAKPKPDLEKARACVEKMNTVQADAERTTLEHIWKVRALLTEEQGQRYAAMIYHEVCTACPLGIHHPS